ncbi:HAD-IA family hydrolase [Desulfallas sp. Bu1-1]|uniref:HAD-IA family hydrolase n=1 Tax=Desulfallas sp. Bu1-1 TaxID=2787620 RepID=UPI0018A1161F|nr:HAD-IA family hydrolase [Desulfallas sp. Bu1-1]MBF7082207.1 HAD-IA family hydrolase [Desulfallas sp. Bu1-1]
MIKHVIWDFDGTIVDSRYLAVKLLNELAEKYKFHKIKESEYEYMRSLSILERCKVIGVPLYMIPILAVELKRNYQKSIGSLNTFKGVKDTIRKLKEKGFGLSIISSNSTGNISDFLKKNNIDIFDGIYSSSNFLGKEKAIQMFLRKNNLKREEVVYIGDECRDIVACQKNNVRIIAVPWGYDSKNLLIKAKPDFIVSNPQEIVNLITFQG